MVKAIEFWRIDISGAGLNKLFLRTGVAVNPMTMTPNQFEYYFNIGFRSNEQRDNRTKEEKQRAFLVVDNKKRKTPILPMEYINWLNFGEGEWVLGVSYHNKKVNNGVSGNKRI